MVSLPYLLAAALALGGAASVDSSATRPAPPVLPVPSTVVLDTIEVRREKLSLREIIERSIEGERSKLAGRRSMVFTGSARIVLTWDDRREVVDVVSRTYAEAGGFERTIQLGERVTAYEKEDGGWVVDPDAGSDEDDGGVRVEEGDFDEFEELPLWLEATHEFDYELRGRTVQSDRVIFEVGFRPKSEFDPLPSGTLWIDTERYRVIHEEFHFERNPFPLMVRDLRRLSRQWTELPTGEWVYTKVRAEMELRSDPFGYVPESVVFVLERRDFAFDTAYDPHVFGER